jgi:hypothetical protein
MNVDFKDLGSFGSSEYTHLLLAKKKTKPIFSGGFLHIPHYHITCKRLLLYIKPIGTKVGH